jgi:hypothetical protein
MDDLAPAPAQRISDNGARTSEASFAGRRKAAKKLSPVPVQKKDSEPALDPEPETDHQIDVLA